VEEHSSCGGLGSAVADYIACSGAQTRFAIMGLPDTFFRQAGSQGYLRDAAGISARHIAEKVKALVKR
jgi:transketolase